MSLFSIAALLDLGVSMTLLPSSATTKPFLLIVPKRGSCLHRANNYTKKKIAAL